MLNILLYIVNCYSWVYFSKQEIIYIFSSKPHIIATQTSIACVKWSISKDFNFIYRFVVLNANARIARERYFYVKIKSLESTYHINISGRYSVTLWSFFFNMTEGFKPDWVQNFPADRRVPLQKCISDFQNTPFLCTQTMDVHVH